MKLKDCDCGGIPEATYKIDGNSEFVVVCEACGNQTPVRETLEEAVALWNQTYCRALSLHQMEPA